MVGKNVSVLLGLFWSSDVGVLVVVQGLWLFVVLIIVSVWIVVVEEVGRV